MKNRNCCKRKRPIFTCVKAIAKIFYKKPKFVYLGDKIEDGSIILANHMRKKGPIVYDCYLPVFTAKWGAGEMLGTYKDRWHYLRDIFYMQKRGFSRGRANFKATFESIFSPMVYKGLSVIGTFHDARLKNTINKSYDVLSKNTSVLIFPENSDEGYFDELTECFAGFVLLAEKYYRETGKDVPIRTIYFHEKQNLIVVDEPSYLSDFKARNLTKKEIAEEIRLKINAMYHKVENGEITREMATKA